MVFLVTLVKKLSVQVTDDVVSFSRLLMMLCPARRSLRRNARTTLLGSLASKQFFNNPPNGSEYAITDSTQVHNQHQVQQLAKGGVLCVKAADNQVHPAHQVQQGSS